MNDSKRLFNVIQGGGHWDMLDSVDSPVVTFIIEDEPSNFYCKVAYVIESTKTREWWLFDRGAYALEGDSGLRDFKGFISHLKDKGIDFSCWVIKRDTLDDFENGTILWQNVKSSLVPLNIYHNSDSSWSSRKHIFIEAKSSNS